MADEKLYLLAEISALPQFQEEVKAIFAKALDSVLKESGCEAMYTTSLEGEPNKLIFFEVFSSEAAHKFHMEQGYTQRLAVDLEGKLAGPIVVTRLKGF
jgi:quinol monooxygenase YgiN